jgi:hypothetical protein
MKKLLFLLFCITTSIYAQTPTPTRNIAGFGAGFSTNDMHSSAIFEGRSTTKGFLFPRMTTTQRNAIVSPALSLIIFNTTVGEYNFYNGSSWESFGGGGGSSNDLNTTTLLGNFTEQNIEFQAGAGIDFNTGIFNLNLMQNSLTDNRTQGLPDGDGTLVLSVNDSFADDSGNIIQTVNDILSAGNESTSNDLIFRFNSNVFTRFDRLSNSGRLGFWDFGISTLEPNTFFDKDRLYLSNGGIDRMQVSRNSILMQSTFNNTEFYYNKMNINGVDYLYPNTATSRIATLLDIPSPASQDLEITLGNGNVANDLPIILGSTVDDVVATFSNNELVMENIVNLDYATFSINKVEIRNETSLSSLGLLHDRISRIKGDFQTDLIFTNPTVNREIVFQDEDGVVAFQADVENKVFANPPITGATKTKITYDSKGLVTAGSDLTNADLPTIDATKIADGSVTDSEFQYISTLSSNAQTQINSKENKSLSAHTFRANNTSSTADGTEITYRHSGQLSYTGTPTFTFTTSAPSGTESKSYNWQQIGNRVVVDFVFDYSTAGSGVTQIQIPMPSDLPDPVVPTGFTGASVLLYIGTGQAAVGLTQTGASTSDMFSAIRRNASDTDFEFIISATSAGYRVFRMTIEYPVN